jgi:hypothetical protein
MGRRQKKMRKMCPFVWVGDDREEDMKQEKMIMIFTGKWRNI